MERLADKIDPETVERLADKVDPETIERLADKIDPETIKRIAEKVDPETLRRIAEKFNNQPDNPNEQREPPIDEETARKLAESLDPETIDKLREAFEGMEPPQTDSGAERDPSTTPPTDPAQPPPSDTPQSPPQDAPTPNPPSNQPENAQENQQSNPQQPQDGPLNPSGEGEGPVSDRPDAPRDLSETLRDLESTRRNAAEQRRSGDRARDIARELADRDEAAERARMNDARTREGEGGANGQEPGQAESPLTLAPDATPLDAEAQNVDASGQELADELIASWIGGNPNLPAGQGRITSSERAARAAAARRVAERAVNESNVPSRYHDLIKRYFGDFTSTVEKAAGEAAGDADTP
ncbi:MAG: hypothetical protein AAF432_15720 [Planctomycetota bacterium]